MYPFKYPWILSTYPYPYPDTFSEITKVSVYVYPYILKSIQRITMYPHGLKSIRICVRSAPCSRFNPHNTDIFYHLIIPCRVQLDPRPRFTICTYQNETDCLHLLYISYLTSFIWHIKWLRIKKVPLQQPWATFLSYKQKNEMAVWAKWARYSIPHNFLNICDRKSDFVSLPMFSGSRKPVLTFNL